MTTEAQPYDPFRYHSELTGGGLFDLASGQWSASTAMALALADGLIKHGGWCADAFMTRLADWFEQGRFSCQGHASNVDMDTLNAVWRFIKAGPDVYPRSPFAPPYSDSLSRLAPVVLAYLHDKPQAQEVARAQSHLTAPQEDAAEANAFLAGVLHDLILGVPNALGPRILDHRNPLHLIQIAAGSYLRLRRPSISDEALATLETALWALSRSEDFEAALIKATSLGGNARGIGAITGMLAGASYGLSAIPDRWLQQLAWKDEILDMGQRLLGVSGL